MSRSLFLAIAALAIAVVPVNAGAQPAPGVIAGVVRDALRRPGAWHRRPRRQPTHGIDRRCRERRAGRLSQWRADRRRRTGWRPNSRGSIRWFAQVALEPGQTPAIDVTLAVSRLAEALVVTARRTEEAGAGGADPGVGRRRRPHRGHRCLQREPAEGPGADRAVLHDQPAQLGRQHSRHRRAVRAHQRRHRAGRRHVCGRRVLRASRRGDARLPRRRAHRGAARAARHALRQEHDGRRHQRHDAPPQLHAGGRGRDQLRQLRASCRPAVRSPARSRAPSPRARRSRAPSAVASSATPRRAAPSTT